jgi:hypothetical protein
MRTFVPLLAGLGPLSEGELGQDKLPVPCLGIVIGFL